jgi:ribosomal protein S18 acetylase RimI-like enzyme
MSEPTVRLLEERDLADLTRIDAHWSGRRRPEYLRRRLESALRDSAVRVSLGAELDGALVGFVLGSVFFGEFGRPEPFATIDTIAVHPELGGRGIAGALWRQLARNVHALGIERIETQVAWNDWKLLAFLERMGFRPAARTCLEAHIDPRALDEPEG